MDDWTLWKRKYQDKIKHIVGYEEKFVDLVLCRLPGVEPNDVIPQYHFKDDKGGNRFIDFMIINKEKGFFLPIELDGTYKDTNHARWKDFLIRQNALITQFGIVLRFSNKQMLDDTRNVIDKIHSTLTSQSRNQITEIQKNKEREKLVREYKKSRSFGEVEAAKNQKISDDVDEIKQVLSELKNQIEKPVQQPRKLNRFYLLLVIIAIVGIGGGVLGVGMSQKVNIAPTIIESKSNEPVFSLISAEDASHHYGESKTVCGYVSEVKPFSSGTYINFTKPFPDNNFTAVVWDSALPNVAKNANILYSYSGKSICVSGQIESYKHHPQIVIRTAKQISKQ